MYRSCLSAKHRDSNPEQADVWLIASFIHDRRVQGNLDTILDCPTCMGCHTVACICQNSIKKAVLPQPKLKMLTRDKSVKSMGQGVFDK